MGGGASVLSPELSKKLTAPSLERFRRLQEECEAKNMSAMEMYVFLHGKYEELVATEQELIRLRAKQIEAETNRQSHQSIRSCHSSFGAQQSSQRQTSISLGNSSDAEHPSATSADSSHSSKGNLVTRRGSFRRQSMAQSKKKAPRRRTFAGTAGEDECPQWYFHPHEAEAMALEVAEHAKRSQEDLEESLEPVHDPYVEAVVSKVFNVVDDPRVQKLVSDIMGHEPSAGVSNVSVCGQNAGPSNPADPSFFCYVCQMHFTERKDYEAHNKASPLHLLNVTVHQGMLQDTLKEAERLALLAQHTISRFAHAKEDLQETIRHCRGRERLKKVAKKVISLRLKQQLMPVIETMFPAPPNTKLLYASSKFFIDVRASFDIQIFEHMQCEAIELVPHFLPRLRKLRRSKEAALLEREGREAASQPMPCSRLYLDRLKLLRLALGLQPGFALLSPFAQHSKLSQPSWKEERDGKGKESKPQGENDATVQTAMISFLLRRLRACEEQTTEESVLGYRIYMDISDDEESPILDQLPRGLRPVPLTVAAVQRTYADKYSPP